MSEEIAEEIITLIQQQSETTTDTTFRLSP